MLRCTNKLVRSLSSAPPRRNAFKQALKAAAAAKTLPELQAAGFPLLGLWASAGSPQVTELVALAPGLSWLAVLTRTSLSLRPVRTRGAGQLSPGEALLHVRSWAWRMYRVPWHPRWLVIDMEHAPNTLPSVLAQLHAAQAASAEAMVRVPCANDPVIVKQVRRARLHPHLHPRPGA